MARPTDIPKTVKKPERTDKKPGWRERARANWQKLKNGVVNRFNKARAFVKDKAIPWLQKNVTKENLEKIKKYAEAVSKSASTVSDAARKAGGVVGGKTGAAIQRGADNFDKKHEQAREYVKDKVDKGKQLYDKGKQVYNIGRDTANQVRRNMRERG